jgi:Ca2+-binding EF-hand superfamily protein
MSNLTEEQIEEICRAAFDKVDTDCTGEVDIAELSAMLIGIAKELHDKEPTKQDIFEMMKKYDTDKSGKLSYAEFKELMKEIIDELYN